MKGINANDKNVYGDKYIEAYRKKRNEGRIDRIFKYCDINENDYVLDIGCGSGYLYPYIKEKGAKYLGIDESELFIKEANSNYIKNKEEELFLNLSLNSLKDDYKNKFTKIFLLDVTEHLTDKEILDILNISFYLLKSGGSIIIHTPNLNFILEQLKKFKILKQTDGHIGVRNSNMYSKLFLKSKFKNSFKTNYLSHYLKLLKPLHIFSYIPFVGRLFEARLLFILNKS